MFAQTVVTTAFTTGAVFLHNRMGMLAKNELGLQNELRADARSVGSSGKMLNSHPGIRERSLGSYVTCHLLNSPGPTLTIS